MITQSEIEKLAELKELSKLYSDFDKSIKARFESGEEIEAGGWQLNPTVTPRRSVSWKDVVIRLKGTGYANNVLHNTKPVDVLSLKPAFSIAAEKAASKSA